MARTRIQMDTLIDANLGTQVGTVTAAEHREVEGAMLDYVSGQVIDGGSVAVGNGITDDVFRTIGLSTTLSNNQYMILGHLVSLREDGDGQGWNRDNDMVWCVESQTTSQFVIRFGEWSREDQNVDFHWIAISTPGVIPPL